MQESLSPVGGESEKEEEVGMAVREVCANGLCMKTTEVEAKLDEGNIQEAESSLREGLSLNFEVQFTNNDFSTFRCWFFLVSQQTKFVVFC